MKSFATLALGVVLVSGAFADVLFNTSFESGEGFAPGGLDTQNDWISGPNYQVVSGVARTGSQSVRWSGTGGGHAWPDIPGGYSGANPLRSSVWIMMPSAGSDPERVFGLRYWSASAGFAGVTLGSDGTVRAGTTYSSLWGSSGIQTVISNPTDRWIEVGISYTPNDSSATVMADGQFFSFAVTPQGSVLDVDFFSDWDAVNVNTTGYWDDYFVTTDAVPEPATLAALGIGLAAVIRRRRR